MEDFSFFDIKVVGVVGVFVLVYIYWLYFETKSEHFQDPYVVEIFVLYIEDISEGNLVCFWVDLVCMKFHDE